MPALGDSLRALAARADDADRQHSTLVAGMQSTIAAQETEIDRLRARVAELEAAQPRPKVVLGHFRARPGETGDWLTRVRRTEAQFGPFAGHARDYLGVGHNGQLSAEHKTWLDSGGRLFLNWKPWSATWAQVASGARDAAITAAAKQWAPYKGKLRVTIGHEPDNDLGAAGSGMTAADYVGMFRRAADLIHRHAPGVPVVWTVMGFEGNRRLYPGLWPGAGYVDVLGHNPYIKAEGPPGNLAKFIVDNTKWLRANLPGAAGKPVMVTEWGADLGGDTRPYPTGDVGTAQHRADAISGVTARLGEIAAAGVVELDLFDARSNALSTADLTGVDARAYKALKTATES